MTQKANIIVIGAGIVGVSVAYHLARKGAQNIVLLDKGNLDHNDGSTSHAPGGLRVLTPSYFYTKLGSESRKVYDKLPLAQEGVAQFFRVGLLQVANKAERFDSYKRIQEMGLTMGIACDLLTPKEVQDKLPLIDPSTIYGGMFIPDSGTVKTSLVATSMRREAEKTGNLTSYGDTEVTEIVASGGRVTAVLTNNPEMPRIECEQVVLCNNIWAPVLCEKLGVPMPLFPGEHQYIFTEPTAALDPYKHVESAIPIVTMDDISVYFRQHGDRIGIGSYHHEARLVDPRKLGKEAKLPFTPDDFTEAWRLMQGHMPVLHNTNVSHGFNGMFSFTVDHYPIMGETAVKGFWTAIGAWLSYASEVGRVMARWMLDGDPGMDVTYANVNRFHPYQSNHQFLTRQSKYYYEIGFDILHPNEVASSVRNLRYTPYHARTTALGGQFIPMAGIETPYWYEANAPLVAKYGDRYPHRTGWEATSWSPIIGAEHIAMRENVGLIDWTAAIGPIEISGPGALDFLQRLCSNDVDKPINTLTYTLLLTTTGNIKRDMTVLRLAADRFWLLTGKSNLPAELFWIRQLAPSDGSVTIVDRAEEFVSLALWGPNARQVLQKTTNADLSNAAFPFYTAQDIGIGMTPAKALRISYVGELGWEIYAPASYGLQLWDALWEAGRAFGMPTVGIAALLSLRLEKGYRLYGADMTTDYNPYEAGLGWMVKHHKGDFVGREAALAAKQAGAKKKLVCLTFADPQAIMYGYEPVFVDGKVVGRITSGDYGYSVGKFIAYAYVDATKAAVGTKVNVRYTGRFFDGEVAAEPLFDKGMLRLRG
ncbi:MAG: FAD-dependent oxidoreductase [Anaerolineales bacterium]|nr:FAD-dependent oxidoreductase [Anaerolineales bacterium]